MNNCNLIKYKIDKMKNTNEVMIKSEWLNKFSLLIPYYNKLEDILMNILNALDELNRNNAYHGKLYLSNILMNDKNEIILVDYFEDKLINPLYNMNLDNIRYLSPEHFRNERISIKSDIFSFGSIFYFLLSNEKCFEGKSKDEIKTRIINCEYYPFDEIEVEDENEKEIVISVNKLLKQIFVVNQEERIDLDTLKIEIESIFLYIILY